MFAGGLHLNAQELPVDRPESDYTEDQEKAIDRVDQLSERLRGMPWDGGIVNALSRLGTAACQHDKDLGNRVFERAYWVAAGIDFDLNEESSTQVLLSLAHAASSCDPGFRSRSPTRRGDLPEPKSWLSLRATLSAVKTNPGAAAGFAQDLAESFSDLDNFAQRALVSALTNLRQQWPSEADGVFQHALLNAAISGSVTGLFALGNYVFGPSGLEPGSDAVLVSPMLSEGKVFGFAETRPGIPSELAKLYVASSSEGLAHEPALPREGILAYALTRQLASWSDSHAPHLAPVLGSLVGAQRARLDQDRRLPALEATVRSYSGNPSGGLEEEIEAAPDEATKARLRFKLASARIRDGDLEGARELAADLEDETRRPLLDIIALGEVRKAISGGDLEAARLGLSTLSDKLHLALAALSLASAHWNLADGSGNRLDQDVQAALEAIHLARSVTAQIPEHIRPHVRLAIVEALARTEQFEESMVALELALHEFNTVRERERPPDGALSLSVSTAGRVHATVVRGEQYQVFSLLPSRERATNFLRAVLQLSTTPEADFDRLEGIVTSVVDPRMRTSGLVALAQGALANAFGPAREPLKKPGGRDAPSDATPASPSTDNR